jgi:hypothetical protein
MAAYKIVRPTGLSYGDRMQLTENKFVSLCRDIFDTLQYLHTPFHQLALGINRDPTCVYDVTQQPTPVVYTPRLCNFPY